jgi:hypothetical protein
VTRNIEQRLQKLESLRPTAATDILNAWIIVDPRQGQTTEGQQAAWLAANPDAAGREIFWVVWIAVHPKPSDHCSVG